jgi:hypothetical protein
VPAILVDVNLEGHAARIWRRLQSPSWRELTASLDVTFLTFRDVGLAADSPDDAVWRFCQERGYYLLTSNRNEDAEDSLQATIRRENTLDKLPVFTLPLPDRVYHSPGFLERVVEKLLDFILFADAIRGSGRLYLP